ncbi:MAG: ChaN family lipoprotein [Planctomycetota bacterium]
MKSAREELLDVQKRLVKRFKRDIDESIGLLSPELAEYKKEYEREFRRYRISNKAELVGELVRSDVVFVADYHTLKHSQLTLVAILEEFLRAGRDIVLCVEMVETGRQDVLDAFMRGDVKDEEFLRQIDYEESWGFPWSNYRPVFEFAKKHDIRVVGINSRPARGKGGLKKRDGLAGEVVAGEVLANPGAAVVVHDGDLHIAAKHLPGEVALVLQGERGEKRFLRIFQNSERIYWKLAGTPGEQADVVRLRRDAFCVMSSTPLVKYQSYLNWEANRDELTPVISSNWMLSDQKSIDISEQMKEIIDTIAGFFEIKRDDLGDFQLYTTGDLDFFRQLRDDHRYSEKEIQDITVQILKGESYFITREHIIYLGNLSISHAAEEATHFIDHQCGGDLEGPLEQAQDFYYRAMREALGWLGSKVINPKRICTGEKDFRDFLERNAGRKLNPKQEQTRRISRYVVQHKTMERKLFKSRARKRTGRYPAPTLRNIYRLPVSLHLGVTHGLGYMLGEGLYNALLLGRVNKEEIRTLFYEKYQAPDRPFEVYMRCAERLEAAQ